MGNYVLHRAQTRGFADHGWLQSYHTFSFSSYHNPERVRFGALRVLNDDTVAEGRGFGKHPHDNMEIISLALDGAMEHRDSMGNVAIIQKNDVQVMSAGTGIFHSEMNHHRDKPVKFLQIWVFPNKRDVEPRYGQITTNPADRHNRLQQILSPSPDDEGVWIHQNAWFHLGKLDAGTSLAYDLKMAENGVYVFILAGKAQIGAHALDERDGLGVWDTASLDIKALTDTEILLMEVPML